MVVSTRRFPKFPVIASWATVAFCAFGVLLSAAPAAAQAPLLSEALRAWSVVGTGPADTVTRTNLRSGSRLDGAVCSDQLLVGWEVAVAGGLAATSALEPSAIKIRPNASLGGDIVTDGGRVTAIPRRRRLPGLFIGFVEPDSLRPFRSGVGVYDTTGAHPLVRACTDAQNDLRDLQAALAALPSTQDVGKIRLSGLEVATIVVDNVGGRNVIDAAAVLMDKRSGLVIDGGGDPNTTVVLRVARRLRTRLRSLIVTDGGLTADRLLIAVDGARCKIGELTSGEGSLFCAADNFRLRAGVVWNGAFLSTAATFETGDRITLAFSPGDGL